MQAIDYQDLCFLTIKDLKNIISLFTSTKFRLKADLIKVTIDFLEKNGYKVENLPEPQSFTELLHATHHPTHNPALNCYMLQETYKHNKQNRAFFEKYIGKHFKFSALTNDWLKYRWQKNNPPTYGEFIMFWKENHHKKYIRAELAYNSFFNKNTGQTALKLNWHKQKQEKIDKLKKIIQKIIPNKHSCVE